MGLMASEGSGESFPLTEEGTHLAVCYGVIDLGHQHNEKFSKDEHKIMIMWELPNLRIDIPAEGDAEAVSKPRAISRKFTLSLSEKSHLRPFLESWRGKKFTGMELVGFDIQKLVGVNCQLQVLHHTYNEKTYANVHAVLPVMKGTEQLAPENPTCFYSMEDSQLDFPDNVPEWIEKIIMKSREWLDNSQSMRNDWPDENPADFREGPPPEEIPF